MPKQAYLLTGLLAYELTCLANMLSYISAYIGDHKLLLTAHYPLTIHQLYMVNFKLAMYLPGLGGVGLTVILRIISVFN